MAAVADPNVAWEAGLELADAIEACDVPRALAAIAAGAGVDEPIGRNRNRPLGLAVASGRLPMVIALLAKGAGPSVKSGTMESPPIVLAVKQGAPMARALIAAGADLDAGDATGSTALHQAAHAGRHECVLALLEAGAGAGAIDSNFESALQLAVEGSASEDWERCVALLAKPTLAASPRLAAQAMKLAANLDGERAIAIMGAAGFDLEDEAGTSFTPLGRAAMGGRARSAKALLDAGALPGDPANGWWSAAAAIARAQGHEAISAMIEERALAMRERSLLVDQAQAAGIPAEAPPPVSKLRM